MESNKTAVIEGRLDIRDVATCADFLISVGNRATSKSDLLYKVVTSFANSAAQHHEAKRFEYTDDAVLFLEEVGLGSMNRAKIRGKRGANAFTLDRTLMEERGRMPITAEKSGASVDDFINLIKDGKVRLPGV